MPPLGFIGAGNMGGAMLSGLTRYDVTVAEPNPLRAKELQERFPNVAIAPADYTLDGYVTILAVKPQIFPTLKLKGEAEALVSIMASVSLESLKTGIKAKKYVRAMPNIAALKNRSATAVTGDKTFKAEALEILSSIGSCFWVESEKDLNIATALAGSAPAWLALVAEALCDGAVQMGLKREESYKFTQALFEGVGELLKDEHPALIKDKVMSPGGTTAQGYAKLEEHGVRAAFMQAIEAAYKRAEGK